MNTRIVGLRPVIRRNLLSGPKYVARSNVTPFISFGRRNVQTESLPPSASQDILDAQRIRRPSSPHFTIYQPQLTWLGSIANRATGTGLSILLYGFAISYLTFPVVGMPFASTDVVQLAAALPESLKLAAKVILAAPFAFHSWNGLRHLGWDVGKFLTVKQAYSTGYAVLGLTAVTTIALVLY